MRVGMSDAGLLHHFRNKKALLQAVLDHRDALSSADIRFDAQDGVESLRDLVRVVEHNTSIPGVIELYCTLSAEATSPDHPAHAYFVDRYVTARTGLTALFQRIAEAGQLLPGVDPYRAAVTTIAVMDGAQVQWLLNSDSIDMPATLAELFRTYVSGYDAASIERAQGEKDNEH